MIHIQVSESLQLTSATTPELIALLEQAAVQAMQNSIREGRVDLTLLLTDDAQIQSLNRQFLGIDAPTDVLAFPAGESDPDSGALYLGDVVLSYPRAQSQARGGGHALEAELQLLAVHGILHLLGYDHTEEDDKAAMWAVQAETLGRLGCPIVLPAD